MADKQNSNKVIYKCPKCNQKLVKTGNRILSRPPEYEYRCNKCGHIEYN